MSTWPGDEIHTIAEANDLHIAPFRDDGKTYGTPTWVWSVVVDGELYVRAYNGQASSWYQAALRQKAGRITVAGMTKEVTFEPVDAAIDCSINEPIEGPINRRVDDAYRTKYKGSPYLQPMVSSRARSATMKIALLLSWLSTA
jgi:hypothetical protein